MSNQNVPQISSSMRRAWRSCGRKVFFRYIAGIEPVGKKPALIMGSAFHVGLEAWRRSGDMEAAANEAVAFHTREMAGKVIPDDLVIMGHQLRAYLVGYARWYGNASKHQVVEAQMFEEGDGETGFCDTLYQDENGKYVIVEDKTTAVFKPIEELELALRLDDQLLSYAHALHVRGIEVDRIEYRQTKKTGTWQTKKETPEEYRDRIVSLYMTPKEGESPYREIVMRFTPTQIEAWAKQKERQNLDILSHLDLTDIDAFPLNPSECMGAYGKCDFLSLCAKGCDGSQREFKPNGKVAIDGSRYQSKIWGVSLGDAPLSASGARGVSPGVTHAESKGNPYSAPF